MLRFPSEEALRVVITSQIVDPAVSAGPAKGWRDEDGVIFVEPSAPLGKAALKKLEAAGVESAQAAAPKRAKDVRCWAELVPLSRAEEPELDRVLFVAASARSMLDTAAELLRLGCDRQELRRAGDAFLLRTVAPPFYTLTRAVDRVAGLRAFVPAAGNDVWVEYGYAHPLAKLLKAERDGVLLLSREGWLALEGGAFTDLNTLVDLEIPTQTFAHEQGELPRLRIALRLERGRVGDAPALWVIRADAVRELEKLVVSFPEEIAQGLLFAMTKGEPPVAVIRTRPTLKKGVELDIPGEPYRQHGQIPNLFVPIGWSLEPPVKAETVRGVLAPDPAQITWVRGQPLVTETLDEDALRPLADFVDYVVDRAQELDAWMESAKFELSAFEVADADFSAGPRSKRPREQTPKPEKPEVVQAPRDVKLKAVAMPKDDEPIAAPDSAPASRQPALEQLARIEREFIAMNAPADDPAREPLWLAMGEAHAQLERRRDAGLCFTRAIWESKSPEPIAKAWAQAETAGEAISEIMAKPSPTRDDARAVAALLTAGATADPAKVTNWLDLHDDSLDLRSLWLARLALSRLSGGDALGLARARDRVLRKLHRGLSVERDIPTFLRFLGGERDPAQLKKIASRIDNLSKTYEKTKRKLSPVEAEPKLTLAYVLYVLGYGFARLGQQEKAREHVERATSLLPKDPVHAYLSGAYRARVQHAIDGEPLESLLPPDVVAKLDALDAATRYKVDRVRQYSQILEPNLTGKLDAAVAFQKGEKDPRGPEFEAIRMLQGPELEDAVLQLFAKAASSSSAERRRLYDGLMDFFPALRAEVARDKLEEIADSLEGALSMRDRALTLAQSRAQTARDKIVSSLEDLPAQDRCALLEEALMLSGHIGDEKLARRIAAALEEALKELEAKDVWGVARELAGALRTLRRVGLKDEAESLLSVIERASEGTSVAAQVARLHTAGALAHLGRFDLARPVFDATLRALKGEMNVPERLELTRALSRAVSSAPQDYATPALDAQVEKLPLISDGFSTNSHLCLSVVVFMECIVLGYASDDLGMGDTGRQWLDDDEYLIRRRIHRDMT